MKIEASDLDSFRPLLRAFAQEVVAELREQREQPADNGDGRIAYSEAEAAAKLGLEAHHLREQRRLGAIEFCRGPGRRVLYTREQIMAFLMRGNGEEEKAN